MSGWNKSLPGITNNVDEAPHFLEYATSQECWEQLNESFLTYDSILFEKGGLVNSGLGVVYNVFIKIRNAWVDPEFNYGRCFNYTMAKWNTLLNNYIDFNKLDLLRSRVRLFSNKNSANYNISYIFNNTHNNGKQCLLAATFSKRFSSDIPIITMIIRASEITKRLMFDFLLIQRMAEYVYGPKQTVQINLFCTQMYGNIETLIMYDAYKPLKKVFKKAPDNAWVNSLKSKWEDMKSSPESKYSSFKVFFRSFKVLRPDLYEYKPLLAKDMRLDYDDIEYPEDCITFSQRNKYKKKYLKDLKKNKQPSN